MPVVVSVNGVIVPAAAAVVSVFDRGFLYGDSVYETVHSFGGRCFRLSSHLVRLHRSAELLGIAVPIADDALADEIANTVAAAGADECAVRVVITRGEGPIGIDPRTSAGPSRFIIARPLEPLPPAHYTDGVHVVVARTTRNSSRALSPEIKSGNFLNNILAMREAIDAGAFEAILLNPDANVAEGTQSNVFLVQKGALLTPDPRAGLLRGVTRQLVLELALASGLTAIERDVFVSELYEAEEIFLTSTLKGVLPVTALGARRVGDGRPGVVTRRIAELYAAAVAAFRRS